MTSPIKSFKVGLDRPLKHTRRIDKAIRGTSIVKEKESKIVKTWKYKRFGCCMVLTPWGTLNGYVSLPADHPYFRKSYDEIEEDDLVEVHGGLTFSAPGGYPSILPDNSWYLGFDTAHAGDVIPAFNFKQEGDHRWTEEEVVEETNKLAEQLSKITKNLLVMVRSRRGMNR